MDVVFLLPREITAAVEHLTEGGTLLYSVDSASANLFFKQFNIDRN